MKRFLAGLPCILGLVLLTAGLVFVLWQVMAPNTPKEDAYFYFLQTAEDADCTLLLSGGYSILIDTGEAQDYEAICALLQEQNLERIDCLILTHPDKDHIGSAQALAEVYPIGLVVEPYYARKKDRLQALHDTLDAQGIPRLTLSRLRHFTYGDLGLTVYPPEKTNYKKDNNYSLAIEVTHGAVSLFFAGDAYTARTKELLELPLHSVDLYHASYHGRDYENGTELLEALSPRYVVVTSDQAGKDTQQSCDALGCQVFYTRSGTVWMRSDGKEILPVSMN